MDKATSQSTMMRVRVHAETTILLKTSGQTLRAALCFETVARKMVKARKQSERKAHLA